MNQEKVTYCGLYCGLCASRHRIPQQAASLREALCKEGYDRGYFDIPGLEEVFAELWKGLNYLADHPCPGCQAGGGNPGCIIRNCAQEKEVTSCPFCKDYPCEQLGVLHRYPLLMADARWLQQVGLEQWISEQEERAKTGLTYTDVRLPEET